MTYRGHIENGQILLDEPTPLPEGAQVSIEVMERHDNIPLQQGRARTRQFQPIEMPGGPLADDIIRDRR